MVSSFKGEERRRGRVGGREVRGRGDEKGRFIPS